MTEHLMDIHEFPGNKHFKECEHEALVPEPTRERPWLQPDSLVSKYRLFLRMSHSQYPFILCYDTVQFYLKLAVVDILLLS